MAFNPEDRITWEELAPSLQELFKNLQSQITKEVERARNEELRLDRKIDDEIARATARETQIESKLNSEISRSKGIDNDHEDRIKALEDATGGGGGGGGADPPTPGGGGLIDVFVINGREFYVHFTNGFKLLGIFTKYKVGDLVNGDPNNPGTVQSVVKPWMTGFTGFTSENTFSCLTGTDEAGVDAGQLDLRNIIYSRAFSSTEVLMFTQEFYYDSNNVLQMSPPLWGENIQFTICMGY